MIIVKHHPYEVKDIGENMSLACNLFKVVAERIDDLPWMVGSGTALGLYRDGGLIPTDTDLDFIFTDDLAHIITETFADFTPIVTVIHNDVVQQLAYVKDGIIVDFHFYHQERGTWVCHHQNGVLEFDFGQRNLFNTTLGKVGMPENIIEMLEKEYGKTWQTPQHRRKPNFKYKRGVLFGVFDPLHYGHIRLFEACRERCNELAVVVRSDEHIRKYKNREPFLSQEERVADVAAVIGKDYTFADKGTWGWDAFADWSRTLGADVFFASIENEGKIKLPIPVIYMPRTE